MNHPLDFFDNDYPLRDEQTGQFPRPVPAAIEAMSRAYRALIEVYSDRTYTPKTLTSVRALRGLRGGPNRALVEAIINGDTTITGQAEGKEVDVDGNPVEITVSLRQRTRKQQDANSLPVERAFDALRPAVIRFDKAYPPLATSLRAIFLADDRIAYGDFCQLAVTPVARRAAADILGALGKTERAWDKATSFLPVIEPSDEDPYDV